MRLGVVLDRLRESLWVLPGLGVVIAAVLQRALIAVDRQLDGDRTGWFVFQGGAESARGFLAAISTSTLTMATLGFSVTMLVLQLASSQLSPRVMRTFLRDRHNQIVLALFIGTFTYALLVLREVRDDFVPGAATWAAFLAALASIAAFVYFINHIAQSIRVSTIIERVGSETLETIERLYPETLGDPAESTEPLPQTREGPARSFNWDRRSGVLTGVDERRLLALCDESDAVIELVPMVGDFVGRGSVFALAKGSSDTISDDAMRSVLAVGVARTMQQDAAFGFRQLVDIAVRALSPGVNDPTTAVQVLDQLHDLLLVLAGRDFPASQRTAVDGRVRLVVPRPGWGAYVALALDEIRSYGSGSLQVMRRMRFLLDDLLARAPASRRSPLEHQVRLLDEALGEAFQAEAYGIASLPDAQGPEARPYSGGGGG